MKLILKLLICPSKKKNSSLHRRQKSATESRSVFLFFARLETGFFGVEPSGEPLIEPCKWSFDLPRKIIWHRSIIFKTGRTCQTVNNATCQSAIQIVVWNRCRLSFRTSSLLVCHARSYARVVLLFPTDFRAKERLLAVYHWPHGPNSKLRKFHKKWPNLANITLLSICFLPRFQGLS